VKVIAVKITIFFEYAVKYSCNVPCFGTYSRRHHQAVKTLKNNYYVHRIMLFYIIHM